MNWRDFISNVYLRRNQRPGIASKPALQPPATAEDIANLELRLDVQVPEPLKQLLLETNGVMDMLAVDGEWYEDMWIVWNIEQMIEMNLFFRTEHDKGTYRRDFRELFFIAGAGADGIHFGHAMNGNRRAADNIIVWHPICDELNEAAPSLSDWFDGWLTGTITV